MNFSTSFLCVFDYNLLHKVNLIIFIIVSFVFCVTSLPQSLSKCLFNYRIVLNSYLLSNGTIQIPTFFTHQISKVLSFRSFIIKSFSL